MQTISLDDAPNHLAELQQGESFMITHGHHIIAQLIPLPAVRAVDETKLPGYGRPKVGEGIDDQVEFSDDVFAPLTAAELKEWGL
jgi:antitoxin (DNA-binding transcriptional repressor) of toxin-antitoxin stability system